MTDKDETEEKYQIPNWLIFLIFMIASLTGLLRLPPLATAIVFGLLFSLLVFDRLQHLETEKER